MSVPLTADALRARIAQHDLARLVEEKRLLGLIEDYRAASQRLPDSSAKRLLFPHQMAFVDDPARFKVACMARQIGKSFCTAAKAVEDASCRKQSTLYMTASERQAIEWMRYVHSWAEATKVTIENSGLVRTVPNALLRSAFTEFYNGTRILAIPANPKTARGYPFNVIWDEAAHAEKPKEVMKALFFSIANPLSGEKGITVISTPNGINNPFHKLCTDPNLPWSRHFYSIYDAVALGLPNKINELREGLGDPDSWAQEAGIQFLDSAMILLPYDLMATCEDPEITTQVGSDYWTPNLHGERGPLYIGIDFGRTKNLTVAWTMEQVGDVLTTREILELENMDTPSQYELLSPRVAASHKTCLDWTGPGVGLGDWLARDFGVHAPPQDRFGKIELCNFTLKFKQENFPKLKQSFEEARLRVPQLVRTREDLHSVQRIVTPQGNVTYRAPNTDAGHADRCVALMLAERAARHGKINPGTMKPLNTRHSRVRTARRSRALMG